MKRLQLKCKPLDDLLNGGLESKTILEIYGEAGTGKTNICLQAAREYASIDGKVAYIDSDGKSVERLKQICDGYDYNKILKNILFSKPLSFEEQEKMIIDAVKLENIGLFIVDTFNRFYITKLENDEEGANRSLNRQLTNLQLAARENNIYVIITGQVYSTEDDDVKPFAGRVVEHMITIILKLEKTGVGKKQATIIKHRSQPKGKKAFFKITAKGLE